MEHGVLVVEQADLYFGFTDNAHVQRRLRELGLFTGSPLLLLAPYVRACPQRPTYSPHHWHVHVCVNVPAVRCRMWTLTGTSRRFLRRWPRDSPS